MLLSSFRKFYGELGSELPLARCQPFFLLIEQGLLWYFYPQYLANGNPKAYKQYHFLKELNKIFQMHLNICCHHQKIQKNELFFRFQWLTLEVNKITRQITQFFSGNLWALPIGIFRFCISRPSKFSNMGSPFYITFRSVIYTFTRQR